MSAVSAIAPSGDVPTFSSLDERKQEMSTMYEGYKAGFPEVTDITAAEVKTLLDKGEPLILVDIRTDEEQAVSMIEGALTKATFEKEKERHKGDAIVTYCTAGARSGKYAAQLGKEGFINVRNMKGSLVSWTKRPAEKTPCKGAIAYTLSDTGQHISTWTHEGLPVVDASGQPTNKVHAFGPKWQALYAPEYDSVTFANPTMKVATEAVKGAWSSVFGSKA